ADLIIQHCLLPLRLVERIDEREPHIIFTAQRTHRFTVEFVNGGLRGGQAWREDIALADNRHVDRQVMAAELNHPGFRERRRAEKGQIVFVAAEGQSSWASRAARAAAATSGSATARSAIARPSAARRTGAWRAARWPAIRANAGGL